MSAAVNPEQPMFLRVPVKCRQVVIDALRAVGFESEAADVEQFTNDYVKPELNEERLSWLALARKQVAKDGEIEFDSDATISHSQDGQYVLGWVWVDGPLEEDEEDDDG